MHFWTRHLYTLVIHHCYTKISGRKIKEGTRSSFKVMCSFSSAIFALDTIYYTLLWAVEAVRGQNQFTSYWSIQAVQTCIFASDQWTLPSFGIWFGYKREQDRVFADVTARTVPFKDFVSSYVGSLFMLAYCIFCQIKNRWIAH